MGARFQVVVVNSVIFVEHDDGGFVGFRHQQPQSCRAGSWTFFSFNVTDEDSSVEVAVDEDDSALGTWCAVEVMYVCINIALHVGVVAFVWGCVGVGTSLQ